MPTDSVRRIELDAASLELRRQLGPTAWVVFEELLLASTGTAQACEATVSVRALAARLGLAKDTIARALTRLRHAGLVTAAQSRSTTGVFATGHYRLHIPDSITLADHATAPSPITSRPTSRPHSTRPSRSTVQLSLAIEP